MSISGQTLEDVLLGVSDGSPSGDSSDKLNCSGFRRGILGLDRSSDVLKAFLTHRPANASNVFSFAFRDTVSGRGDNLFSLGGYAGLDPKRIFWMPHRGAKSNSFRIQLPYVIFKNRKWAFPHGHTAVIDTGCSYGILPGRVLSKIYSKEPGMMRLWYEGGVRTTLFNSTTYCNGEIPTMVIGMENYEWLTDIADPTSVEDPVYSDGKPFGIFLNPTFIPSTELSLKGLDKNLRVPSVIGGSFLNNLRGLVFDFTPGKERVGFVPRCELAGSKTGLINPLGPAVRSVASGNSNLRRQYLLVSATFAVIVMCLGSVLV